MLNGAFITLFLILSRLAFAGDTPLTLAQAIETAYANSPDVRQLQEQYDSASAKKRQALAPSEPTFSASFNDLTQPFNLGTTTSRVFQLTQPLGFPGRAFLNRSALDDQAQSTYYQLRAMKLQVATNVKQAYYGLALAQRNIQFNADLKLSYERILSIAKRRYETGATSQVDFLNAQVQLLSNENDLHDLLAAERTARAQLNVLLKQAPDAPVQVEPIAMQYHPAVSMAEALPKMLESRNELRAARFQYGAADKAYKLAWMSILPDFQLVAGTTFYNVPAASPLSSTPDAANTGSWPTHTYMAGIQFTIPVWFLFNEREAIVGAAHDRAAADANLDIVHNQSKIALETAVDSINSLRAKIENFEKHMLPLSEQSLNLALINYSSGKIDFQTLSDTAAARRSVRLSYLTAVVSYLTTYATYGQLIGEDL